MQFPSGIEVSQDMHVYMKWIFFFLYRFLEVLQETCLEEVYCKEWTSFGLVEIVT